jgi:mannose-6-phosphate isomerase-like protein (cupin superfamily)
MAMRWVGVFLMVSAAAMAQSAPGKTEDALAKARVFRYDEMPVRKMGNGGEMRQITRGVLASGEAVSLHESVQPAGAAPSPLHVIQHSEFVVVLEGTVEFDHDGKTERAGPGDVMYVAFGTLHRMKNVGDTPAKYLVVAVGGDVKK